MTIAAALLVWAALLYGVVGFAKYTARAAGLRDHPAFVRTLPLVPYLLGAITGAWVLPAVARQVELAELAGMPVGIYAALGLGAGGLASLAYKVVRQTLAGDDKRLFGRE